MLIEVRSRLEAAHARLHSEALAAWCRRHGGDHGGRADGARRPFRLPVGGRFARLPSARPAPSPRITRDHSLVQVLVENGTISEAEAARHPQANVITRAVGADIDLLELDKRTGQLQAGDRLLLCSDGLSKTLPEELLAELLSGDDDDRS